jgi:hypothetical protein
LAAACFFAEAFFVRTLSFARGYGLFSKIATFVRRHRVHSLAAARLPMARKPLHL